MLTYEAQMQQVTVENHLIVENDWIRFTQMGDDGITTKTVQIDVKENTTSQQRTHAIGLNSGTEDMVLTVIQAGKP